MWWQVRHPRLVRWRAQWLSAAARGVGTRAINPVVATGFAALLAAIFATVFAQSASAKQVFTEEAALRGLNYTVMQGEFSGQGQFGCGMAVVDLDGDGDDDVVCLGAANERLGFFANDGSGHFSDVSASTGLREITKASGIAAADFDGDGDLDLAVTRWIKPVALLRNDGNFVFVNVAAAAGLTGVGAGTACAWGDYDNDGWLDLAVANRTQTLFNMTRNKLWHNNGNGTFTDVTAVLGVDNGGFPAFALVWCDLDRDNDLDLYVANDKGGTSPFWNRLYRNRGDGTFFEDFAAHGNVNGDCMGTSTGDLDGDGVAEVLVSNVANGNFLLKSLDGGAHYFNAAAQAGVQSFATCWGAAFFDASNDGLLDLFVASSTSDNFFYAGASRWPLVDAAEFWGLSNTNVSYCVAQGDIDRDGDVDLLVQDWLAPIKLYVNSTAALPSRGSTSFDVHGRGGNTRGVGVRIVAECGGRTHWREVSAGSDYKSQSSYRLHLGTAALATIDSLTVTFPRAGCFPAVSRVLRGIPTRQTWPLWPPEKLGDANHNGARSDGDRVALVKCIGAACTPALAHFDCDGDNDIDSDDLAEFDRVQCDLTGDRRVDGGDLSLLIARWGGVGADFDDTGDTDKADLLRLLAAWGE